MSMSPCLPPRQDSLSGQDSCSPSEPPRCSLVPLDTNLFSVRREAVGLLVCTAQGASSQPSVQRDVACHRAMRPIYRAVLGGPAALGRHHRLIERGYELTIVLSKGGRTATSVGAASAPAEMANVSLASAMVIVPPVAVLVCVTGVRVRVPRAAASSTGTGDSSPNWRQRRSAAAAGIDPGKQCDMRKGEASVEAFHAAHRPAVLSAVNVFAEAPAEKTLPTGK